jgi:hypothetical protein
VITATKRRRDGRSGRPGVSVKVPAGSLYRRAVVGGTIPFIRR